MSKPRLAEKAQGQSHDPHLGDVLNNVPCADTTTSSPFLRRRLKHRFAPDNHPRRAEISGLIPVETSAHYAAGVISFEDDGSYNWRRSGTRHSGSERAR